MMNQRSYVKAVSKHLRCSKARAAEFVRYLEADIAEALSAGESWELVERRMGDPRQVAAEFNEDLPVSEVAAGTRRKRLRIAGAVAAVAVVLLAVVLAAAWWVAPKYGSVGYASGHEEGEVAALAEQVVLLFNEEDVNGLAAMGNDAMKSALDVKTLEAARATINDGEWGAFESFGSVLVGEFVAAGAVSNPVEAVVVYENVTVKFTLAFDKNLRLTALYVM